MHAIMRKKLGRSIGLVHGEEPPPLVGRPVFQHVFPSTNEAKNAALEALLAALVAHKALSGESEESRMRLCLDEALINAVMHGNQYDAGKIVRVKVCMDSLGWSALVEDQGPGFHEEDLPDPDAIENLLEESGRGVHLIRSMMDEASYWRGGSVLLLVKRFVSTDSQRLRAAASQVPLQRRVHDLESILAMTRAMGAEPDLTRLLVLLAASCSKVLQVERTSIWVVDPQTGELFTRVAEKMDAIRVPRGKGIVGAVAAEGQLLLIPDAYADPRFNQEVDRKTGFRTRQILCIPLKDVEGARVVGVIQALNKIGGQNVDDYDVELGGIIAAQVGVVLEQAALRELAIEKKRLQAELDLARSIQQRLLPQQAPTVPGLDVAGINRPATETSGDYFDYVTLPDGRLAVVIADVTGHGLGAALIMTSARSSVRALCAAETDPGKIVGAVNDLMEQDLDGGNFLSLCLAAFNPAAPELHYTSAGHDPPLVYRPGDDAFAELDSNGPLLGILAGMAYPVAGPLPLKGGDVLIFMTDGLFECMNAADETFGKERVRDIIRKHAAAPASDILNALLDATTAWTQGQPPRDDITVVVVKVMV